MFHVVPKAIFLTFAAVAAAPPAPPGGAVSCASRIAEVDDKFRISNDSSAPRFSEVDQAKLCEANARAVLDQNRQAESLDDASVCRSVYAKLKNAIAEYKTKLQAACDKEAKLTEGCAIGNQQTEDPKESFRCVARNARAASAAQKEAAAAMERAKTLANELRQQTAAVREKYKNDLAAIAMAYRNLDADIAKAKADGDMAKVVDLQMLGNNASGVKDGRLVAGTGLLAAIEPRGETTSLNGGQETIQAYRNRLSDGSTISGGNPSGILVVEQTRAKAAAEAFNRTADVEIQQRSSSASGLDRYALENENRAAGRNVDVTPSGPKSNPVSSNLTGGSNNSSLPDAKNMAGLAQATSGLAGATKGSTPGSSASSIPSLPGSLATSPSLPNLGGGADPNGPGSTRLGDSGANPRMVVPVGKGSPGNDGPANSDRGSIDIGREGGITSSGGAKFVEGADASLGPKGRSSTASSAPTSGKTSAGKEDGIKDSGRKLSSTGSASCPPGEKECGALQDLKTAQFNAGGSLGVPTIGAPDPGLSTLGALDNLFGPLPPVDGGLPTNPTKSAGGIEGLLGDALLQGDGALADSDGTVKGSLSGDSGVMPINNRSLFLRAHGAHERAVRKGTVSLFHKKL